MNLLFAMTSLLSNLLKSVNLAKQFEYAQLFFCSIDQIFPVILNGIVIVTGFC
jgi:hypothetical protein